MEGEPDSEWEVGVGEVLSPVGLRGEVKVRLLTDFPSHLAELSQVCLAWDGEREQVAQLEHVRFHGGLAFMKLEGIDSRERAEELRGCEIRIKREMCTRLEEGEYYLFEVVGLEVVNREGESLGKVREVLRTGSNDVYVTEHFLIPATHEAVVSIDVKGEKIVVRGYDQVVRM
jgi:16S rRNA processing protein RimM